MVTADRLDEIDRLTRRADAYGFRAECAELVAAARRLLADNEEMRFLRVGGEFSAALVADRCEAVARLCDSSLHEAAALKIRSLLLEAAALRDRLADADRRPGGR